MDQCQYNSVYGFDRNSEQWRFLVERNKSAEPSSSHISIKRRTFSFAIWSWQDHFYENERQNPLEWNARLFYQYLSQFLPHTDMLTTLAGTQTRTKRLIRMDHLIIGISRQVFVKVFGKPIQQPETIYFGKGSRWRSLWFRGTNGQSCNAAKPDTCEIKMWTKIDRGCLY